MPRGPNQKRHRAALGALVAALWVSLAIGGCASVRLLDEPDVGAEGAGGAAAATPEAVPAPDRGQGPPSKPPEPDSAPAAPGRPPVPDAGVPAEDDPPLPDPPDDDGAPPEDEPAPPDPPDDPDQPPSPDAPPAGDDCQGLDFIGECDGTVLRYCDNGTLAIWDCAWSDQTCGWVDAEIGYDCGGAAAPPDPGAPSPEVPGAPGGCGTAQEARVVTLVNADRAQRGLGALACDAAAVRAAQLHSLDQCDMGLMSHTGSDGSDAGERMRRVGGQFGGWGENVAYGATTPEEVHAMWMGSPGHHANIMGAFRRIGVGLAPCNGMYYWTEAFLD